MYIGIHVNFLYSRPIIVNLELSRQFFEKQSNIKFHENPSSGAEYFHMDGQTDRHDEAISPFTQFFETS